MSVMEKIADHVHRELLAFNPEVIFSPTGSVYFKFADSKIKQIRISNHGGHKQRRNTWDLRSDAMTHREKFTRVYNIKDVNKMILDFIKSNSK